MTHRVLLIGINYIGTENELHGCINDVVHMRQFLQENVTDSSYEVRMLTDAADNSLLPTAKNIIDGFRWLTAGATSDSRLFLHYSGHGGAIPDASPTADNGQDSTICPLDFATAGQIRDKDLRSVLVDVLPAGCRLTCIFDSCHSGTILDLKYNWVGSPKKATGYHKVLAKHPETSADVLVLSGCMDKQTSADAFENGQAQGALTYAFLECMKNYRISGILNPTCNDLLNHLHVLMESHEYSQVPVISCGQSDELSGSYITQRQAVRSRGFAWY